MPTRQVVQSNEQIVYVRVVAVPQLDWQLADSRQAQLKLESRKRLREPGVLDRRPPNTRWVAYDVRAFAGPDSHIVRQDNAVRGDPQNEHDRLGHGALAMVLGAPTSGVTSVPRIRLEGAVDRLCSYSYLERHFRARLAHVVVEATATRPTLVGASPFLRGCAPLHEALVERGCCDWRPDGFVFDHKPGSDEYRIYTVSVGGVCMVRFEEATNLQIGDCLYLLLKADAYDAGHAAVRASPALSEWLTRAPLDYAYAHEEIVAYMAERDALLASDTGTPLALAEGASVQLSNFRVVAATSSDVCDLDGGARKRLGLRAAGASGAAEVVAGMYRLGRVLETKASGDGLLKVYVAVEYVEAEDGPS